LVLLLRRSLNSVATRWEMEIRPAVSKYVEEQRAIEASSTGLSAKKGAVLVAEYEKYRSGILQAAIRSQLGNNTH